MAKPRIRYNYPVEIALVGPSQTSKEGRAGNKPLAKVTLVAKHPKRGDTPKEGKESHIGNKLKVHKLSL